MGQDSHNESNKVRIINSADIALPAGYIIDVFAEGLTTPINLIITNIES